MKKKETGLIDLKCTRTSDHYKDINSKKMVENLS